MAQPTSGGIDTSDRGNTQYEIRVSGKRPVGILYENVIRLVEAHPTRNGRRATMNSWTSDLGLDPKVLTIATLEQIANGVSLQAWQLLVDGMDPASPPTLFDPNCHLLKNEAIEYQPHVDYSPQAEDLARTLDLIESPVLRDSAYAMALNILENMGKADRAERVSRASEELSRHPIDVLSLDPSDAESSASRRDPSDLPTPTPRTDP
jgi:hypothetical protein